MTSTDQLSILFVEDNTSDHPQKGIRDELAVTANVDFLHPEEVAEDHLRDAHVVLLDQRLKDWAEREAQHAICLKPMTGLALAAVFRSHSSLLGPGAPKAFCILTNHPEDLVGGSRIEKRGHVLGMANGLEWVFDKRFPVRVPQQVLSLADAVQAVRDARTDSSLEGVDDFMCAMMALNLKSSWSDMGRHGILSSKPPLIALEEWDADAPMTFLRWLLHRILPYPTFLLDSDHLAVRLGITEESLTNCLAGGSKLAKLLSEYSYNGVLAGFAGHRWWRAGVDDLLWESLSGDLSTPAIQSFLTDLADDDLVFLEVDEPVVVLDERLEIEGIAPLRETVRLAPDDWPSHADTARTTTDAARGSTRLALLVHETDRSAIELAESTES